MKVMVSELTVNEEVISFFFIPEQPQLRKSKKEKDYLCLKLQDKTGVIDARLWDIPSGLEVSEIKKGTFVKVRGQVSEWDEKLQISVSQLRLTNEADAIELEDFFERCERDPNEMFQELVDGLEMKMQRGRLKDLVFSIIYSNREKLLVSPAAKSVHHAYLGGLLEHILSMANVANMLSDHYDLNKDLMLAACVLHDIGKIHELTYPMGISYSLEGTMLGHISIGMQMVSDAISEMEDFPKELRMVVLHMVASHHGLLEYGSPKVPLMREAVMFHLVDMLDAQNMICLRATKKGVDEQGLTDWVKELGGPLFVMKEPE